MPFLEVDDQVLTESGPICRYVASKFNLRPSDAWENAQMEAVIDWYRDFQLQEIVPFVMVMLGLDTGDKKALYKNVFVPASNKVFPRLMELLEKSKSGYLADSGLSWGDIYLAESTLSSDVSQSLGQHLP